MKGGAVPKQKPLQGGKPIRGGDTLSIVQDGYSGKIPTVGIVDLERETAGIMHGTATLTLHIKDGYLIRYTTSRERSFVPGRPTTGGCNGD
jgi:hypothetical protein